MTIDLQVLARARVLVIGDVMLDRYWSGDTARISPEAPVPVVHVKEAVSKPGGAANVALNIVALGATAYLLGVCGDDEAGELLQQLLTESAVQADLVVCKQAQTVTKLRVLSRHQQLIRLDHESGLMADVSMELLERFVACLPQCDAVILSDYNKGCLQGITARLIALARAAGKAVFVDPKGQDATPYRGASLLTPNQKEFEAFVGASVDEDELMQRARALIQHCSLDALLLTRSEKGLALITADDCVQIAAQVREVFDVTGAGDTVIAVFATAAAAGLPWAAAARLANFAAGIVVGKQGAASVSLQELSWAQQAAAMDSDGRGVLSETALLAAVARAKQAGETIVMTNGCFDLLHAGHVDYLQAAAAKGSRLIVAVNDDASVSRLKGETRPLVPCEQRMRLLAALRCVDWVVSFSEDTPARLIAEVLPQVLVKGGDYTPEQIAGHEIVLQHGGEVMVLPFVAGLSTSALLKKIRDQ